MLKFLRNLHIKTLLFIRDHYVVLSFPDAEHTGQGLRGRRGVATSTVTPDKCTLQDSYCPV